MIHDCQPWSSTDTETNSIAACSRGYWRVPIRGFWAACVCAWAGVQKLNTNELWATWRNRRRFIYACTEGVYNMNDMCVISHVTTDKATACLCTWHDGDQILVQVLVVAWLRAYTISCMYAVPAWMGRECLHSWLSTELGASHLRLPHQSPCSCADAGTTKHSQVFMQYSINLLPCMIPQYKLNLV